MLTGIENWWANLWRSWFTCSCCGRLLKQEYRGADTKQGEAWCKLCAEMGRVPKVNW